MSNDASPFHALTIHKLSESVGYREPYYFNPDIVYAEASALEVMTDLNFVPAASVQADATLTHAHQMMMDRGVRLLFAIGPDKKVQGLLTATDVLGTRPGQAAEKLGIARAELLVRHVMTELQAIEVLALVDVVHARVGDIVATLKDTGRQHALVVDRETPDDDLVIRGIFSASQIARQLGLAVEPGNLDHTFEMIDTAVRAAAASKQAVL